jgi:hypothetical protein
MMDWERSIIIRLDRLRKSTESVIEVNRSLVGIGTEQSQSSGWHSWLMSLRPLLLSQPRDRLSSLRLSVLPLFVRVFLNTLYLRL